ncbi:MAG: spermidine synthase, partial [Bauldia sp.]|nr:spermidine synthase [Bauldia sp.]
VEPSTMLFDSAVATIGAAFDNLDFYNGNGNIVIVAYNGPKRDPEELKRIAAERQAEYGFRYDLTDILSRGYQPDYDATAEPLTDDFAPVEYLKAIDRHNQKQT